MAKSKFYIVCDYYDRGLWGKRRVHDAVVKGWITPGQYEYITGKAYGEA